jgi:hypothetical protein
MRVATYDSFFFLVDVAAGFLAVVFWAVVLWAVVFVAAGFLVAVVFFFAAVVFFWAVDFAAVGFLAAVVFLAAVFRGVVFASVGDVTVVGSLEASTSCSWAAVFFFVEAFFLPFTCAVPDAGIPSHAGRVPIAQSTGFCAWWWCSGPGTTWSFLIIARPRRFFGSMPRTAFSTANAGFFASRSS